MSKTIINKNSLPFSFYLKHYSNNKPAAIWRYIEINTVKKKILEFFNDKEFKDTMDFGCGDGFLSGDLFNRISIGLEIDPFFLNNQNEYSNYDKVKIGDINYLNFETKFDLIYSNSVLEHISNVEEVLYSIYRVLKNDSYFIFTVPNVKFDKYNYINSTPLLKFFGDKYSKFKNTHYSHYNIYEDSEWIKKMETVGFKHVLTHSHISYDLAIEIDSYLLKNFINRKIGLSLFRIGDLFFDENLELKNNLGINSLFIFKK